MELDFYSVAIPEPTTILGLRLRPFSLGHLILLHRVRSGFVTPGETVTLEDLALSVLICARSYAEGCDVFNDPDLPKFFKRWHDKLAGIGWLTCLKLRKPRQIPYAQKMAEFSQYLSRGSSAPYYSYNPSESKPLECPTAQIVKVVLMREMGFSEAELMDRPWSLCLWDYVTIRALDGNVTLTSRETIHDALAAADALAEKLKGNKCQS